MSDAEEGERTHEVDLAPVSGFGDRPLFVRDAKLEEVLKYEGFPKTCREERNPKKVSRNVAGREFRQRADFWTPVGSPAHETTRRESSLPLAKVRWEGLTGECSSI